MFSQIDQIIFPNSCEVVEIPSSQQYVFLIFKNASSSLRQESMHQLGKTYNEHDVNKLSNITVYLRDPMQRYISGVNTFVNFLLRDNAKLDLDTIMHFVNNYRFLNLHYAPQFFWLLNLHRFINPGCTLTLLDIESAKQTTEFRDQPVTKKIIKDFGQQLKFDNNLELWFHLDYILRDFLGETLTFDQIYQHIKLNHNNIYHALIAPTTDFLSPYYGMPKT